MNVGTGLITSVTTSDAVTTEGGGVVTGAGAGAGVGRGLGAAFVCLPSSPSRSARMRASNRS